MFIFPFSAANIRGHLQCPPGAPGAGQGGAIPGCARQRRGHAARRGCAVPHHGQWGLGHYLCWGEEGMFKGARRGCAAPHHSQWGLGHCLG